MVGFVLFGLSVVALFVLWFTVVCACFCLVVVAWAYLDCLDLVVVCVFPFLLVVVCDCFGCG